MIHLRCGSDNPEGALSCQCCGELLPQPLVPHQNDPVIGLSYSTDSMPDELDLKTHARKAVRFLVVLLVLLFPLGILLLGGREANSWAPGAALASSIREHPAFHVAVIGYFWLLYAYMIAKTGESVGASFMSNFLMALFPFLIPAVWARIGRCPVWRPYLYLLIDAIIIAISLYLFRDWPYLIMVLVFCLTPFLIHQVFGCSIGPVANLLGLNPYLTVGWLCLGPILLFGILFYEALLAISTPGAFDPWTMTLTQFREQLAANMLGSNTAFMTVAAFYGMASLAVWIKTIYEDLKLPVL